MTRKSPMAITLPLNPMGAALTTPTLPGGDILGARVADEGVKLARER